MLVAGITAPHYIAHAYLIMTLLSFTLSTAVCGYHVYQDNWEPDIEDQLYYENPEGSGKRSLDVLGVLRIGLKYRQNRQRHHHSRLFILFSMHSHMSHKYYK